MQAITYTTMPSPIGDLLLVGGEGGLAGVYMPPHRWSPTVGQGWRRDGAAFVEPVAQLGDYFAGVRTGFDLPLAPRGTPFQLQVWEALREVPYGQTVSYGQLAARIGRARASRAVGLAIGRNPISIVVPCHRVIGKSGALTGYGGGLDKKRRLLALEARLVSSSASARAAA